MTDEADELPLAKVDYALRHVERHVHNRYLTVGGCVSLVGQQGIIDHPCLSHRLLWILKIGNLTVLVRDLFDLYLLILIKHLLLFFLGS